MNYVINHWISMNINNFRIFNFFRCYNSHQEVHFATICSLVHAIFFLWVSRYTQISFGCGTASYTRNIIWELKICPLKCLKISFFVCFILMFFVRFECVWSFYGIGAMFYVIGAKNMLNKSFVWRLYWTFLPCFTCMEVVWNTRIGHI